MQDGALTFNIIVLLIYGSSWLYWRHRSQIPIKEDEFIMMRRPWACFPFFVTGMDKVTKLNSTNQLLLRQTHGCLGLCCALSKNVIIPLESILNRPQAVKRHVTWSFLLLTLIGAIAFGFWIHFWPCAWWSCDGSSDDEQGVRGFIWLCSSVVVFIVMLVCRGRRIYVTTGKQTYYMGGHGKDVSAFMMSFRSVYPMESLSDDDSLLSI